MGSAFHQLCPRYNGTLTPTAPTANRLWETFTFNRPKAALLFWFFSGLRCGVWLFIVLFVRYKNRK